MHPRTSEVLAYFEAKHGDLASAYATVPSELRTRRPAADRWTVAEILAHVAIVEQLSTRMLRSAIRERASDPGLETDSKPVIPTVDVERLVHRGNRLVTGLSFRPPPDVDAETAYADLLAARAGVRSLLLEFDGFELSGVLAPNPVLGLINVYQWVVFLGAHEARHALQISELGTLLTSSP